MTPAVYTRPRTLTPNIERWMRAKGFIDERRCVTLDRTVTPEAAAMRYAIRQLEDAPKAAVDETC